MNADFVELAAYALGAWASGFVLGLLVTFFRKLTDML